MIAPKAQSNEDRPQKVGFFLIPGFALMSYAAAIEPLRAANLLSGRSLYEWCHISPDGEAARASTGALVPCDLAAGDEVALDLLIVCAGGEPATFDDARTLAWIRRHAAHGTVIGGVSGGPVVLAKAGVAAGRRMTVHWEHAEALKTAYPDILLGRALYVIDRDRVTCAGGVAPLDLMHALIAERHGAVFAQKVSDWFLHTDIRPASGPQRGSLSERYGVRDRHVIAALELMENHIADPLSSAQLAQAVGLSLRQLERLFRERLARSPMQLYRAIRLERGRTMVRQTSLSLSEVALACGFASNSHFSREYRKHFATTPAADRARP